MSFNLIREVWQLKLTPTEQQVLMAMADYADDDGRNCFPSQPRLAWKTGLSERTIVRTIDALVTKKIVKVVRPATNKAPPHYEIWLDMGEVKAPFISDSVDFRDVTMSPQIQSRDDMVTPQDALGCHSDTSRDDTVSVWDDTVTPDPIINLSTNQPGNKMIPFPETATEKSKAETAAETARIWSECLLEIGAQDKTIGEWLQGSELIATGSVEDGKPLYRVLVVNPRHVEWIKDRMGRNIRWRLSTLFRMPVAVDVISELAAVMS